MERLGSVQRPKREKQKRVNKCERLENYRAAQKQRIEAQKRDERREWKGLDVMRANIVNEAVQDERGQEGEKKRKVKR